MQITLKYLLRLGSNSTVCFSFPSAFACCSPSGALFTSIVDPPQTLPKSNLWIHIRVSTGLREKKLTWNRTDCNFRLLGVSSSGDGWDWEGDWDSILRGFERSAERIIKGTRFGRATDTHFPGEEIRGPHCAGRQVGEKSGWRDGNICISSEASVDAIAAELDWEEGCGERDIRRRYVYERSISAVQLMGVSKWAHLFLTVCLGI